MFDKNYKTDAPPVSYQVLFAESSTRLCVNWTAASSTCDLHDLVELYDSSNNTLMQSSNQTESSSVCFDGLYKYHAYYASITTFVIGHHATVTVNTSTEYTQEDAPGPVEELRVSALNNSTLLVNWTAPVQTNGIIRDYVYKLFKSSDQQLPTDQWTKLNSNATATVLANLLACTNYTVTVAAVTVAVGAETSVNQTTLAVGKFLPLNMKVLLTEICFVSFHFKSF